DVATGKAQRGFTEVVHELETRFPDPTAIETEADKKASLKVFGEYLRLENILQHYDELTSLKALRDVDLDDPVAMEAFKVEHHLSDEDLARLKASSLPSDRQIQDYRSTYNDIRDWQRQQREGAKPEDITLDWDDVVFEVDLLKSQEINLDYILELIFENNKKTKDKATLIEEFRRMIRSSLGNRAKESLVVDFINQANLDEFDDKASIIAAFFNFAQQEQQREAKELIEAEGLNAE